MRTSPAEAIRPEVSSRSAGPDIVPSTTTAVPVWRVLLSQLEATREHRRRLRELERAARYEAKAA